MNNSCDSFESAKKKLADSIKNNADAELTNAEAQALYEIIESMSLITFPIEGRALRLSETLISRLKTEENTINTKQYLSQNERAQCRAAAFQLEYTLKKYNHLFELPLTREASIEIDSLRKKFYFLSDEDFISELKQSQYWLSFKPL